MINLSLVNFILSCLLILVIAWQFYRIQKLDQVRKEFFAPGLNKSFEQILMEQNKTMKKIDQDLQELDQSLSGLYKDNRNNVQKIGFVRFNPFDDAGGNISFALALLNAHDDGVVISSLHGREGTRIYAKQVNKGVSESKLTDEEIKAIKHAH